MAGRNATRTLTVASLALALASCVVTHSPESSRAAAVTSEARVIPPAGGAPATEQPTKELPRGGMY